MKHIRKQTRWVSVVAEAEPEPEHRDACWNGLGSDLFCFRRCNGAIGWIQSFKQTQTYCYIVGAHVMESEWKKRVNRVNVNTTEKDTADGMKELLLWVRITHNGNVTEQARCGGTWRRQTSNPIEIQYSFPYWTNKSPIRIDLIRAIDARKRRESGRARGERAQDIVSTFE